MIFFVAVISHHYIIALIAFAGNVFDLFDGTVARMFHKVSNFGGFLDSTLDRVSDFLIITPFSFAGIVSWNITLPFLLCSFLTSYMRSRGELAKPSVSFAVGIMERTERLAGICLTLILFMLFPKVTFYHFNIAEWGFLIMLVLAAITVLQRFLHAYKNL